MDEPLNLTEFLNKHGGELKIEYQPIKGDEEPFGGSFPNLPAYIKWLQSSFHVTFDMISGNAAVARDTLMTMNGTMIEGSAQVLPLDGESGGNT